MPVPQLLSGSDLATFGGAVTAVVAVTNTLRQVFHLNPRIVGFVTSIVVCVAAAVFGPGDDGSKWILAPLNACLIYCGAAGLSSVGSNLTSSRTNGKSGSGTNGRVVKSESRGATEEAITPKEHFFNPWF